MGKRVRPKGGAKAARWAKGQSCVSNPTKNKHRAKAKPMFGQHFSYGSTEPLGEGKLTAAALLRHDAVQGNVADAVQTSLCKMSINDDTLTLGMTHKTFDTFATDWTQCTNMAFDSLLNKIRLDNNGHKDMMAVLAAVTEIIKENGGKETETEYFAALMSALEVSDTEENLSAVLRLLSVVIRKVPSEILIKKCSQVNQLFVDILTKHAESQNVAIVRPLLGCLSHVLRVQPAAVWTEPEINNVFQIILTYTSNSKPKIRKAGQHAAISIIKSGETNPNGIHPASANAAKHCLQVINNAGPGDTSILYMMLFFRATLSNLPKNLTKQCCEAILKLFTFGNKIMISTGLSSLYGLFADRPSVNSLPADLNAQLITALYDYKPNISDSGPIVAWLAVQQEGLLNLAQQSLEHAHAHLHKFCSVIVSCWASPKMEIVRSAGMALNAVIKECLKDIPKEICAKVLEELSSGLKYQYHQHWKIVLAVLASFIEIVGPQHPTLLNPLVQQVANMRSDNANLEKEIDHAIGKAVATMGPKQFLEAYPLKITGDEKDYELKRSWLLPVLKDNIARTELAFFIEHFLPLAAKFMDRSKYSKSNGDAIGHKTYEVLAYQVWFLLPGFCREPTDLLTSFKNIAKILGTQLAQRKEIRIDIMRGLRTVINTNMEIPENKAELSRFGKNFLPILFNLYTTKPTDSEEYSQRMSALDTIKIYLKIADSAVITNMYDKALEKGNDTKSDDFTKEAIFDLLCCLLEYIDVERMTNLYKCVVDNINTAEGGTGTGKKNYKILEEICKLQTDASNEFCEQNLAELQNSLVKSIRKNAVGNQVHRLKTIANILQHLKDPQMEFAEACIPEAIMCINVSSTRTRLAAYLVLQSIVEAMLRWRPDEKDDVFREYSNHVMKILLDENTERLALFALTKMYYEFKDLIPLDVVDRMLTNVFLLIRSNSPQIAIACMSFLKVFVCRAPLTLTAKYLPNIILAICEMSENSKKHTRVKTKDLLERLIRKFGSEMVNSLVTKEDKSMQKRLKTIRKENNRKDRADTKEVDDVDDFVDTNFLPVGKSRQKNMDDILADSDDDFSDAYEEDEGGNTRGKPRKGDKKNKENNAYIKEGEDDILDFLSSKDVSQKITTSKPINAFEIQEKKEMKRKARKEAFKTASDGRLIISDNPKDYARSDSDDNDEDEMDDALQVANEPVNKDEDEDDGDDETFESMVAKKKRKVGSEAGSVKSRMSTGTGKSGKSGKSGYKPGGSGIHRATSTAPGSEYKSKKSQGDTKVKGRPDPYAYIPMTHKTLNKRKTAGAKKKSVFKNLVKAAKKGAVKGAKLNAKQNAKMKR